MKPLYERKRRDLEPEIDKTEFGVSTQHASNSGGESFVTFPTFLGKTCHTSKNKLPQKFPPISLRSIRCSSYLISFFFIYFLCHVFTLQFLCRFDSGDFYDAFSNLVIFTITIFFF